MEAVQDRIYGNLVDEIELNYNEIEEGSYKEIKFAPCQIEILKEHYVTGANSHGTPEFTLEVLGEVFTVLVYSNCVEVI